MSKLRILYMCEYVIYAYKSKDINFFIFSMDIIYYNPFSTYWLITGGNLIIICICIFYTLFIGWTTHIFSLFYQIILPILNIAVIIPILEMNHLAFCHYYANYNLHQYKSCETQLTVYILKIITPVYYKSKVYIIIFNE